MPSETLRIAKPLENLSNHTCLDPKSPFLHPPQKRVFLPPSVTNATVVGNKCY